ncbi:15036_t:CDS:1, partial [Gigaspora margarita]
KNAQELEQAQIKIINNRISERCEMIDGNQGKMLASLLDKPFSKIKINQLLTRDEKARRL